MALGGWMSGVIFVHQRLLIAPPSPTASPGTACNLLIAIFLLFHSRVQASKRKTERSDRNNKRSPKLIDLHGNDELTTYAKMASVLTLVLKLDFAG